ncbi:transcription repressor OFP7-like [Pyrus x bretschneideri]|uniref:transcription repressor OFP7-like n=1 Tax=Pyrus x bretschneideri TaxID=225117 RepID=UPI00202FE957|nr:transcription repressor OFP7-like [Pyrus x bretschneideri]
MAKRSFKLKFPRVIPLIQFCRPKHNSTLPAIYRLSPVNAKAIDIGFPGLTLPVPPPSALEHPSVKCHVSSKPTKSLGCGSCRSRSSTLFISDCNVEITSSADNDKLSHNHNYNNYNNNFMSPISETENYYRKKRNEEKRKTKRKKSKLKAKPELPFINVSSGNWFSGEFDGGEEISEESGTPIYSSRSFSTEFSLVMDTIGQKISVPHKQSSKKRPNSGDYDKVRRSNSDSDSKKSVGTTGGEFGKIKTVLRPMRACWGEEGRVRESVAVVKKSEDPYEDFRRSMMEMIMEKQIFEAKELEELLHCFLTLNSRHYQDVIVEAFSEIWELLFYDPSDQEGNFS